MFASGGVSRLGREQGEQTVLGVPTLPRQAKWSHSSTRTESYAGSFSAHSEDGVFSLSLTDSSEYNKINQGCKFLCCRSRVGDPPHEDRDLPRQHSRERCHQPAPSKRRQQPVTSVSIKQGPVALRGGQPRPPVGRNQGITAPH